MQVDVIRNLEQLAPLRDAWNHAVAQSEFDSVFVSHEWFYTWAKHFTTDRDLYVVIARDGNNLLGIMPLLLVRRRHGFWTETELRSMSNTQSYKYNFIVRSDGAATTLAAMFQRISQDLTWTSMILDFVPAQACNIPLLAQLNHSQFFAMRTEFHMASPYLSMTGSWEDYLTQRDKKVKKNWDYFERKLEKDGTAELVSITGGDNLEQHISTALEIEESSWKGKQGTAIADSRADTGFYLDLGKAMCKRGEFGLHFLYLNGKPIAFDYCLSHKDHFNVLKTSYDPAYAKDSPGRVLHKKLLRNLFADGTYKIYDLLGASDAWKAEWTQEAQTLLQIRIYNRRPVAIIEYAVIELIDRFKTWLRRYPVAYQVIKKLYWRLNRQRSNASV